MKDLDLTFLYNFFPKSHRINLEPNIRNEIVSQLESDSKFLMSKNLCDYSILLGVETLW